MAALFISDAHFGTGEQDVEREQEFATFLRKIDPEYVRQVFFLGDLFDFWFEYRHVIFSGYFDILRAFADLADAGISLDLVCGNHDFWAGRFLEDQLGFRVHQKTLEAKFGNQKVMMFHGDGLNTGDWGYRIYRRIARARPVIAAFRAIHPDWAMSLAKRVSKSSRRLTMPDNPETGPEAKALREHARDLLANGVADVVICGHAHHPVYEEHPTPSGTGLYINTGDWLNHRSYVVWDGARFELRDATRSGPGV